MLKIFDIFPDEIIKLIEIYKKLEYRQGKARQGKARQGKARQGKASVKNIV
ncbi:hypothetical protein [Brachyspira aalborgi]|uniref:hypothetical protein n=1 Tax=Brachyspira aalborgi TaxID=29522 RepID=UPI0013152FD9|nr:hypothetical protein [Brachyspira aalborgi]